MKTKLIKAFLALFSTVIAHSQNISINTTGVANSSLSMLEILQISATASTKGLFVNHSGIIAGTGYGVWSQVTGASTANIAGYFSSTGGTSNYAIIVPPASGFSGFGIIAPGYMLDVRNTIASSYTGNFINSDPAGWGLRGYCNAAAGASTGLGVVGISTQSLGFGIYGLNTNALGTGIVGMGNNQGASSGANGAGVSGVGTDIGIFGVGTTAGTGNGIVGIGNNVGTYYTTGVGSGGAFTGLNIGLVTTRADVTNINNEGGAWISGKSNATQDVFVAWRNAGTWYKVVGAGANPGTLVLDNLGRERVMTCPETPEILFQDYGKGKLVNGKVHVDLDSLFSAYITVNEKHPLRVFIQLEGDCRGVYVTNQTQKGFDVIELQGGTSDVSFAWFVTANRADDVDKKTGEIISLHADVRYQIFNHPKKVADPVKKLDMIIGK